MITRCPHCREEKSVPPPAADEFCYWTVRECVKCGKSALTPVNITKIDASYLLNQHEIKIRGLENKLKWAHVNV